MRVGSLLAALTSCSCGHERSLHEHYRRGTDCAAAGCPCRRYRRALLHPGAARDGRGGTSGGGVS